MAKEKKNKDTVEALYSLDGKINLLKAFPFGLQHILAMFVANITPIIIVAAACGLGAKDTAMIIQSALTKPSQAMEPEVSFSVTSLPSPDDARAEVSPIVSVAEIGRASCRERV